MSSKREQRKIEFANRAQQLRKDAESEIDQQIWDQDPIKQYVRRYGWVSVIQAYLDKRIQDGVDSPLKYLTLPGLNATDVGLFWRLGLLRINNDGKLNVAVIDKKHAEKVYANISSIGPPLCYSGDLFHVELEKTKSSLRDEFPFDVINLDFCEPIIPGNRITELEIIQHIFRFQAGQSFLLLLTTKPDAGPEATSRMKNLVAGNIQEEPGFKTAFEQAFGNSSVESCMADYTRFAQLAIPKLIAYQARIGGFRVYEHFVCHYQRTPTTPLPYNMVCHSFELEFMGRANSAKKYEPFFRMVSRHPAEDVFHQNLSMRTRNMANDAYAEFIASLPGRQSIDVVRMLGEDPNLHATLHEEAVSLQGWWSQE